MVDEPLAAAAVGPLNEKQEYYGDDLAIRLDNGSRIRVGLNLYLPSSQYIIHRRATSVALSLTRATTDVMYSHAKP